MASIPVVILNAGIEEADTTFQIQMADASSGGVGLPSLASVRIQDPNPMLYTQPTPANQSVSLGAAVKIQVSAKGARMQWQHRVGEGEFTDVPGATGQVLEWSSATVDLNGDYQFVVSSSTGESVTSRIARVEVDPTFTKITEGPHVTDLGASGFGGWGDYNGDGYTDLAVIRWNLGSSCIYQNNGDGTFSRLPNAAELPASIRFGPWGDWDNDGRLEGMVWDMGNPGRLIGFRNTEGVIVPPPSGMTSPFWCGIADYDRDGWLDVYFTAANSLWRNLGDLSFTYMPAAEVGPILGGTWGGAFWGDFDDDGWPDLYVPSLYEGRSYMFRNLGTGLFVAVNNLVTSTPGSVFKGAWGDYDNDGRLDLCTVRLDGTSRVFRNLGKGTFESATSLPVSPGLHNFAAWVDYDNDGFLDLWVSGYQSGNNLFRNTGAGSFTSVKTGSLVNDLPINGAGTYAVAWFDYDNNGFLDAYVFNGNDGDNIWTANQLYRNNGNGNAWLTVKPIGTASNRDAVGAKISALATYAGAARWQRRDITGYDHDSGCPYAHFGLGDATKVDTLRIEWPSGIVQELKDVAAHQILHVIESQGLTLPLPEPLSIQTFELDATGVFQATVNCSVDGAVCVLESSSDLERWTKVRVGTSSGGTVKLTDARAGESPGKFYRVLVP
jgi:hypothetical protein